MHTFKLTLLAFAVLCASGCSSTLTSNTARTAREQMLLSDAVERSLSKVNFAPLAGEHVYIEEKYLECVDKPFVVGSIRHQAMRSGALLVDSADAADVIMELRSGGIGTDTSEAYLGTPEIALPGMLTIPEIRMAEKKTQFGYAKLGMVLFDAKTRQVLGDGGVALAQSDDNNWYVLGVGPFQEGSLRKHVETGRSTPGVDKRRAPTMVAFTKPKAETDLVPPSIQFASEQTPVEQ